METTQFRRRDILAKFFAHPGQIDMVDVVNGRTYRQVSWFNRFEWAEMHMVGPASLRGPIFIKSPDGDVRSYFRAHIRPLGQDGKTSLVTIRVKGQSGMNPSREVLELSEILRIHDIPNYLDRSCKTGQWIIWIFLSERVPGSQARKLVEALHSLVSRLDPGLKKIVEFPLRTSKAKPIPIPFHFLDGGLFGELHDVHQGRISRIDLNALKTIDLDDGYGSYRIERICMDPNIIPIIKITAENTCGTPVAAKDILELLRAIDESPAKFLDRTCPQAQASILNRELLRLSGQRGDKFHVRTYRRGRTDVFSCKYTHIDPRDRW